MSLKPQNLIQAAEADLRRRVRNTNPYATTYEHYAFHRLHVRRAKDARQLLLLALMHPPLTGATTIEGIVMDAGGELATVKANTKLIYGNARLLVDAIKLLEL